LSYAGREKYFYWHTYGNNFLLPKIYIQEAIDALKVYCMTDKKVFIESRIPMKVRMELLREGYRLVVKKDFDLYFGSAQGIMVDQDGGPSRRRRPEARRLRDRPLIGRP
jgi:hypothetical protein